MFIIKTLNIRKGNTSVVHTIDFGHHFQVDITTKPDTLIISSEQITTFLTI